MDILLIDNSPVIQEENDTTRRCELTVLINLPARQRPYVKRDAACVKCVVENLSRRGDCRTAERRRVGGCGQMRTQHPPDKPKRFEDVAHPKPAVFRCDPSYSTLTVVWKVGAEAKVSVGPFLRTWSANRPIPEFSVVKPSPFSSRS